jgi:hypothetical protein
MLRTPELGSAAVANRMDDTTAVGTSEVADAIIEKLEMPQ